MKKRLETGFQGHSTEATSVAVTNDSKFIISGSSDNTVRIWNFWEKRQETVLKGHKEWVNSVTVTSDNKCIISGSDDNTIRI